VWSVLRAVGWHAHGLLLRLAVFDLVSAAPADAGGDGRLPYRTPVWQQPFVAASLVVVQLARGSSLLCRRMGCGELLCQLERLSADRIRAECAGVAAGHRRVAASRAAGSGGAGAATRHVRRRYTVCGWQRRKSVADRSPRR